MHTAALDNVYSVSKYVGLKSGLRPSTARDLCLWTGNSERGPGGAGGVGATAHEAVLEQKWAEVQRVGQQHKLVDEYGDTESVRGRRPRSPRYGKFLISLNTRRKLQHLQPSTPPPPSPLSPSMSAVARLSPCFSANMANHIIISFSSS